MDGEYAECRGLSFGYMGYLIMPANQLEGVANKKYMLFEGVTCIGIPSLYLVQPMKVMFFPVAADTLERAAWPPAGDVNVVAHIRHLVLQAHFKLIPMKVKSIGLTILVQDFPDTTHPLVRNALI
jgi:hypothetical protein